MQLDATEYAHLVTLIEPVFIGIVSDLRLSNSEIREQFQKEVASVLLETTDLKYVRTYVNFIDRTAIGEVFVSKDAADGVSKLEVSRIAVGVKCVPLEVCVNVTLNGAPLQLNESQISYERLSELAGYAPERTPTVVYASRGGDGSLVRGQSVQVVEGMHFNVCITGNA